MRDHSKAFTLIEILCVCIILAIAASVAIPYVQDGYNDVKLSAAARSVMADVYYAQSVAITKQQNVYIAFTAPTSSTGGSYVLKTGAALASATTLKHPDDQRDYVQYLGPCADPSLQRSGLADCTLGTLANGVTAIGFDFMGQPIDPASSPANAARTATLSVPLNSRKGKLTTTLSIEPYTGEMDVSKVKGR